MKSVKEYKMNKYNKLVSEKSLYLQDHATNPILWYPWDDEAFEKAHNENKPIFLSIGYSTCHWCHVMKKESFEDLEIANLLNQSYVSIKVDREERPDIDILYMQVANKFLGSGGWPLNVIITPNQEPIFITTYLSKEKLKQVLIKINQEWVFNKENLVNNSKQVIQVLQNDFFNNDKSFIRYGDLINQTKDILESNFDKIYGGFQNKPKFPTTHYLLYLLYYYKAFNDASSLQMGNKTLYQMYKGGIFDHLNYGFSRYAVDRIWLVPHFEKMLYDNAMLLITYLLYYNQTKDELFKEIAIKIIYFLETFLKDSSGAFYGAIDADSEGIEGKYYLWTFSEIFEVLPFEEASLIAEYFNITPNGNFEGQNILNLIHQSDQEIKRKVPHKIQAIINKLRDWQKMRVQPRIDKKILTSWNSIAIWAFSLAGKILDNNEYLVTAEKVLEFIFKNLLSIDQHLYTRFVDGEKKHLANLEDYAYLVNSLIELYLSTGNEFYLQKADYFTKETISLFHDDIKGGFYFTQKYNDLIIRPKDPFDGAIPSGNSIFIYNLIRLNHLINEPKYVNLIKEVFHVNHSLVSQSPTSFPFLLLSFIIYKTNHTHLIIVYDKESDFIQLKKVIDQSFNPFITTVYLNKSTLVNSIYFSDYNIPQDLGVFICLDGVCDEPIYEVDEALKEIKKILS